MANKATREKCRGSDHEWLIKNVNLAFDGMQWKSRGAASVKLFARHIKEFGT